MIAALYKITNPTYSHYLTLKVPSKITRTPVHIIAAIDTSGSMDDDSKLINVKKSIHAMLDVLTETDMFSLVTFSRSSQIIVQALPVTPDNKFKINSSIEGMEAMGSTNLSAGCLNAFKCNRDANASNEYKTSIILLTDGEANEGVKHPDELVNLIIACSTPYLTIHTFGYGTDHNKELLAMISDKCSGGYNIVNNLDDVATSIGNAFGSVACCVAQGVTVKGSNGVTLISGFLTDATGAVLIGDMVADNEIGLLVNMPNDLNPGWNIMIERYDIAAKKSITICVDTYKNEDDVITKKALVDDLRLRLVEYIKAPPGVETLKGFKGEIEAAKVGLTETNILDIMIDRVERLIVYLNPLSHRMRAPLADAAQDIQFFRTMRSIYSRADNDDEDTVTPGYTITAGGTPGAFMTSVTSPMVQQYTDAIRSRVTQDSNPRNNS